MKKKLFVGLAFELMVVGMTSAAIAGTIYADNFNDGILDSHIRNVGGVYEHNGVLDLNEGWMAIDFAQAGNITAKFDAYIQDGGSNYFNPGFAFITSTGGSEIFSLPRHDYSFGGQMYNHPIEYTGGTYGNEYAPVSDKTSSDYYNKWISISMHYDSTLGIFNTTFGDGTDQGSIQFAVPANFRDPVNGFYVNPSGWGSGHPMQIDNLVVSTAPVPEPATMLLMGTGLAGLLGARRKKKK